MTYLDNLLQGSKGRTMVQFLIKRFIGLIFVVIGVTFITFTMGYFAPGDPIRTMMGSHFDPVLYAQLKHTYGLDQPFFVQYWHLDRKSTRLNSSHRTISYAVFCLKKKIDHMPFA